MYVAYKSKKIRRVLFKCPSCGEVHDCTTWTRHTRRIKGGFVYEIQKLRDERYYCPCCNNCYNIRDLIPILHDGDKVVEEGWSISLLRRGING